MHYTEIHDQLAMFLLLQLVGLLLLLNLVCQFPAAAAIVWYVGLLDGW